MAMIEEQKHGMKRKTPLQLKALETFYSEEKYPTKGAMEDYASDLRLTYKQLRGWFIERRRKEKNEKEIMPSNSKKCSKTIISSSQRAKKTQLSFRGNRQLQSVNLEQFKKNSTGRVKNFMVGSKNSKQKRLATRFQDMLPPDYILKKIFRKDGPLLGVDFDPLPPGALQNFKDRNKSLRTSIVAQRAPKRRKVSMPSISCSKDCTKKSDPVTKHGMGKGLMTVWHATNPTAGGLPTGINFSSVDAAALRLSSAVPKSRKPLRREIKQSHHQRLAMRQRRLGNKSQDRRKRVMRKKNVIRKKDENQQKSHQVECKLTLKESRSQEYPTALDTLEDDDDIELRELQAGPNPLKCAAHLAANGLRGCSLCKDLLPRFPSQSVKMKQLFGSHPWGSSPELVKKLFKVFRFIYTNAVAVQVCPFTLDEFARGFCDKDSMLLGKIHVALLKLLLSDVEMELGNGFLPHASKDCRFLGLLHSVKHKEYVVKFWSISLNPITWTEVLRQVLVAAGYGSKDTKFRKESINKEENHMEIYGLCSGTLKGELHKILSERGNYGSKVCELAKAFQVVELSLTRTAEELELLICSTLSSDITLFEKISPSAYRVRVNPNINKGEGDSQSDTEYSGSVDDDDSGDCVTYSSDDCEMDSSRTTLSIVKFKGHRKRKNNSTLTEYMEIDESHSGEVWVVGLMEGEYSDLSSEEKLDALVALVDLTSAGSSFRMQDPVNVFTECMPAVQHHGGAKIKRSSAKQNNFPYLSRGQNDTSVLLLPIGCRPDNPGTKGIQPIGEVRLDGHPLQSVYLGSDRRYNSYWLFLGPCNGKDPGHRRVYFESSEDGHWEVIDTEEVLCALLSTLDKRGIREARLLALLEKRKDFLCQMMSNKMANDDETRPCSSDGSSPVSDIDNNQSLIDTVNNSFASSGAIVLELGTKGEQQQQSWNRLQALDAWIWDSFYSNLNAVKYSKKSYLDSLARCISCHDLYWRDEKHCKICHMTFELDFDLEEKYAMHIVTCKEKEETDTFPKHKVLSSHLQSLKAAIHAIEAIMPENSLNSAWRTFAHKLWVKRLRRTSSVPELLQVLTDFVAAIDEDWLSQCSNDQDSNRALDEMVVFFPSMPQTTSAVALWLVKLDALIAPYLERVHHEKPHERVTRRKGICVPS